MSLSISCHLRSPLVAHSRRTGVVHSNVAPAAKRDDPSRRGIFLSLIGISLTGLAPPVLAEREEEETVEEPIGMLERDEVLSYDQQNTGKQANLAPNVPVAMMDDAYVQSTLDLSKLIYTYCDLDVYTTERQKCIQEIKAKGTTWVSRYARGGSARKKSARKFYIVVDAVLGHLASNGMAPLPPFRQKTIFKDINLTKDLLSQGL